MYLCVPQKVIKLRIPTMVSADSLYAIHTLIYKTMEQMTGIEPAFSAWEADILPLNYICIWLFLVNEVAILKRFVSPLTSYASFALRFH